MKKILLTGLTAFLIAAFIVPVNASENIHINYTEEISLNEEQVNILKKFNSLFIDKGLAEKMKLNESGSIYFEENDLADLNNDELSLVSSMINISSIYPYTETLNQNVPQTRVTVKNWRIYFTYSEVRKYFSGAASIGPHAVYAAMVALGSVIGGPLGTGITALLGAVGGSVLYSNVIKALNNHRGMYIGFTGCGLA